MKSRNKIKLIKWYQVLITIVLFAFIIIGLNIGKTLENVASVFLVFFLALIAVLFALFLVLFINPNYRGSKYVKIYNTFFILSLIELVISLVFVFGLGRQSELIRFRSEDYTETTATVVSIRTSSHTKTETHYRHDGTPRFYSKRYYEHDVTWLYDAHEKEETIKSSDAQLSYLSQGSTKTIYYNNLNPSWTMWDIEDGFLSFKVLNILMAVIIVIRVFDIYLFFFSRKIKNKH